VEGKGERGEVPLSVRIVACEGRNKQDNVREGKAERKPETVVYICMNCVETVKTGILAGGGP